MRGDTTCVQWEVSQTTVAPVSFFLFSFFQVTLYVCSTMNENFFLLVLLFYADARHRYNNNFLSLFFLRLSLSPSPCSVHIVDTPTMPSINSRQFLSLSLSRSVLFQMGISRERAIAVINIIMSALYVCAVAVALFDLLHGISFFSFVSQSTTQENKVRLCVESLFFLIDDDRCIQTWIIKKTTKTKFLWYLIVNRILLIILLRGIYWLTILTC
jgi:hypothetical protein